MTDTTTNNPIVNPGDASPTVNSPVVEGNPAPPAPAAAPVEAPVVVDPAAVPATDPNAVAPAAPLDPNNKSTPEWAQKRINELTAKRYEAERTAASEKEARIKSDAEKAELQRMLAAKSGTPPAPGTNPDPAKPQLTEEEIERRALEKAAQMARNSEFNKVCNTVADNGKKEFKDDWDSTLKNLTLVGALGQNVSPEFLETAVELESPHKVLHYLGQNLEEAERLVNLPPKKMALEMARIEAKINAPVAAPAPPPPAPISNAPAPVIPVTAATKTAPTDVSDPAAPMDDWIQARQKQIDDRKRRYQRV